MTVSSAEPESTSAVLVGVQDAIINPLIPTGERDSTKADPEVKLHEKRTDFSETLTKKAKQEESVLKRTWKHDSQEDPAFTCNHAQDGITISRRGIEDLTDAESNRLDQLSQSNRVDSPWSISKTEDLEDSLTCGDEAEKGRLKDSYQNADQVEFRGGQQEEDNIPNRTSEYGTLKLDLHAHKSPRPDCVKLKPNVEVPSVHFKHIPNHLIPKKLPFVGTGETESPHSEQDGSLCFTAIATQRLECPGQPHDTALLGNIPSSFTPASFHTSNSQEDPTRVTCDRAQDRPTISRLEVEDGIDVESNKSDHLSLSNPVDSPVSLSKSEDLKAFWASRDESECDSPTYLMWQRDSDGEGNADVEYRDASQDERHFVCPRACEKIMDGLANTLMHEENMNRDESTVDCHQSLSLVYATMYEKCHEGTLQLLSDLLHPGCRLPQDVMSHLLNGILLNPLCPPQICVQAWNLLMRAQRHHLVDKNTVPWSWEMLTAVMSTQEGKKKHHPAVVRMLLEYIVQTLEDDFSHKKSTSELHQSIARATLSCNQHFQQVQDVIKWLFSSIIKSTESEKTSKVAREEDEHIRIVSILQRMLCLALEADRSPAISSHKLSQELFFTLISIKPRRAHRSLLLDSLQSNLLRWKLLEQLLDDACPLKTPVPMSLGRILHFLENCTLVPDPTDDGIRWKKWEELVKHLWMLLVSCNTTMKGFLHNPASKQKRQPGFFVDKKDDKLTKADICKSVGAFLSRSQADVGQALPLHVEESLTYLQDFLLDFCEG
ncbi:SUMO-interacting motif-containing protein 1 isoform X2 [Syngnathus typhle]|uniref:SUMO-interacting motif-containing protein 1 isoform X2 n=1 Tax=Syngnathus typhle TaxID=161592 RepID=UPI002A6A93CD|nr:SUMO-interacting motif-containing protein 1 isoform X2 [Syngnathus typhle]